MGVSDTGISGPRQFPSTRWSAILKLHDRGSPEYGRSIAQLSQHYWKPVFCVIRYGWARGVDEAKDLTQEFFAAVVLDQELFRAAVPERGSFRSFLRGALANFMRNEVREARRLKRGGDQRFVSLDDVSSELDTVVAQPGTPEQVFDDSWNQVVLSRALGGVQATLESSGRLEWFEAFRRYDLEPPAEGISYEGLATELGWTVRKLRRALTETRALYRATVTTVVREYVDGPDDLARELRALLSG